MPDNHCVSNNSSNKGLYLVKVLCAFFVVTIHMPGNAFNALMPISHIAVPIFFMITGFYLSLDGISISTTRLRHSIIKILKMAIVANGIILGYSLAYNLYAYASIPSEMLQPSFWVNLILIGDVACPAFWYFNALIQALVVVWIFIDLKILSRATTMFIPMGIVCAVLIGAYHNLIGLPKTDINISRNFFTLALPCILIGIVLRRQIKRLPNLITSLILLIVFSLLLYLECLLHTTTSFYNIDGDVMIMTIPTAVAVFVLFYRLDINKLHNKLLQRIINIVVTTGRKYTADIYIWHSFLAFFVFKIAHSLSVDILPISNIVVFLASLFVGIAIKAFFPKYLQLSIKHQ